MALVISDELLKQACLSEKELMLEIALVFYQRKKFSIGLAARFAGISIRQMHEELSKRDIPLNISPEDVLEDWQTINQRLAQ
ncbi:MAG: UPF0175 family protein [Saprospiraceae bacterium]|nr:UPF0175 family protein [Saprospiraceae bacterium]